MEQHRQRQQTSQFASIILLFGSSHHINAEKIWENKYLCTKFLLPSYMTISWTEMSTCLCLLLNYSQASDVPASASWVHGLLSIPTHSLKFGWKMNTDANCNSSCAVFQMHRLLWGNKLKWINRFTKS